MTLAVLICSTFGTRRETGTGIGSGCAGALFHRQADRRRHAGIRENPVFAGFQLRRDQVFELALNCAADSESERRDCLMELTVPR